VKGGLPNHGSYAYCSNIRYSLQRASGMIAFVFIFWHVFHMHGWIHADWWMKSVAALGGASFRPYNAASTAALAIQQSPLVPICYTVGVLSCVFHLANGVWTMGITWGVWVSADAQKRANWIAIALGIGLAFVSMGGLSGFWTMDEEAIEQAIQVEDQMYEAKVLAGDVEANSHKRADHVPSEDLHHGDESDDEESDSDLSQTALELEPSSGAMTVPVSTNH
jgi:succinate dehydrogenase / fumarate reductase cytochrome b subunit